MGFVLNKELTFDQLKAIIASCFYRLEDLLDCYSKPNMTRLITEIFPDLSFDAFFDAYKHKLDRKRAEDVWNKLSERDKAAAINYIAIYEKERVSTGAAKLYPKTYLKDKVWR